MGARTPYSVNEWYKRPGVVEVSSGDNGMIVIRKGWADTDRCSWMFLDAEEALKVSAWLKRHADKVRMLKEKEKGVNSGSEKRKD